MAAVLLTTMISVAFERYVADHYSPKRISNTIRGLMQFRDQLADFLVDDDIGLATELLLADKQKQRQFLVFDAYDNEILERERLLAHRFDKHFSHPLSEEFRARGQALLTVVDSQSGQTYYIQIQPQMGFHPWLSPRLAGSLLRAILLIVLSGIVCYLLTRTLTRRIHLLQSATHRLAQNHVIDTQALQGFGTDELGDLGRDFHYMAKQLADSEQARKQMLSDISHELRSPLARQQVAIEIARTRLATGQDVSPQLTRMETESERMNDLIGHIIRIQQLTLGNHIAEKARIDLLVLLQTIVDDVNFEYQQQHKRAELQVADEDQNYTVSAANELLQRAFENIIRNAMSHTHAHTVVMIEVRQNTAEISVTVSDCGEGVDHTDVDKIFQPFVRLDSARNRQTGGYGLGLAIAKAVVEGYGGKIHATHRANGCGLQVVTTFPLRVNDGGAS